MRALVSLSATLFQPSHALSLDLRHLLWVGLPGTLRLLNWSVRLGLLASLAPLGAGIFAANVGAKLARGAGEALVGALQGSPRGAVMGFLAQVCRLFGRR